MLSYRGDLQHSFKSASQDKVWTKKEREILGEIANGINGINVKSMPCGTGRIFWICGKSRYKFYVHASDIGFNIGRTK